MTRKSSTNDIKRQLIFQSIKIVLPTQKILNSKKLIMEKDILACIINSSACTRDSQCQEILLTNHKEQDDKKYLA